MTKGRSTKCFVPVLMTAAITLSGCLAGTKPQTPPANPPAAGGPQNPAAGTPGAEQPIKLKELGRITVPAGSWFTSDEPLSPDGNWVSILSQEADGGHRLWVYPVNGGAGKMLCEIPANLSRAGTLLLVNVGWTSDSRLVFARQGTQPDGLHKGSRGVSVRIAEPAKEGLVPAEIGWVPVGPGSNVHGIYKAPGSATTYVQVGQELWRVDQESGAAAVSKTTLPNPEALFYPTQSPAGSQFAYRSVAAGRAGIRVFDASSGKDSLLLPQGDTMGIFPQWSPDGKYLTYYTAKKTTTGAQSAQGAQYDTAPGEDGPPALGNSIGIMTPDGKPVTNLEAAGSRVSGRRWSENGQYLAYAAINVIQPSTSDGNVRLEWKSIWVGSPAGKTTKICDLPVAGQMGEIISVSPAGDAVYVIIDAGNGTNSLWYCKAGAAPEQVKMVEGGRAWLGFSARRIGNSLILVAEGDSVRPMVQILGSAIVSTISATGRAFTGNVASGKLVYTLDDREQKTTRVVVMKAE